MRSNNPIKSSKQADVAITHSLDIVNQGSIPYAKQEQTSIEAAPKGRQKARGFGLQMRPTEFLVR
jgi:hypothetical protein